MSETSVSEPRPSARELLQQQQQHADPIADHAPGGSDYAHDARRVRGVVTLTRRQQRVQRWTVIGATVIPLIGLAIGAVIAWRNGGLGYSDVVAFIVMYLVSGFGVTIGFHRLLTHRSFDAPTWLRTTFAALGTLAVEGPVLDWVADHRRHHAYSDDDGDPHSPHVHDDDTLAGMLRGLWHGHMGWIFRSDRTDPKVWAQDLVGDPGLRRVNAWFVPLVALSLAAPAAIGFVLTGTARGALTGLIWGGLVRIFALHHATWSINSICHVFGQRPFASGDESTNNRWLSIVSLGESWHNTHHAFPSSAVHGIERGQIDISAMVIRVMERVGLITNVRTPSAGALQRKRR